MRRAIGSTKTWSTLLIRLGFFLLASSEADLSLFFLFSAGKSWVSWQFLPVFPLLLFFPFVCTFCSADLSLSSAYFWLHFHFGRSGLSWQPLWTPPSLPLRQGLTFLLGIWGSSGPEPWRSWVARPLLLLPPPMLLGPIKGAVGEQKSSASLLQVVVFIKH